MDDTQYRNHCLELLGSFAEVLAAQADKTSADDPLRKLAAGFETLAGGGSVYERGPVLVSQLFANCPHLAPLFPRELLWFMGGDCLHLMGDDELSAFQELDERRAEAAAQGQVLDYHAEKARLLNLQ